MRCRLVATAVAMIVSGCGSSRVHQSVPTTRATATPARIVHPTSSPTAVAIVTGSVPYRAFIHALCAALSARNAVAVRNDLPYYQYNSGLRYGTLGDGEGQTGDPGLVNSWLATSRVRCAYFTGDRAGHGTLLTRGWKGSPGDWSLIELDTYNSAWKINDFTFGTRPVLFGAMQTSRPIVVYRG